VVDKIQGNLISRIMLVKLDFLASYQRATGTSGHKDGAGGKIGE
jgi:hypothetical protein